MKFDGFDWDEGNWPKCAKHGLTREEIEFVLSSPITIFDDPFPLNIENRFRAIGQTSTNRYVFIAFCYRTAEGKNLVRPISARYMHRNEVREYVEES